MTTAKSFFAAFAALCILGGIGYGIRCNPSLKSISFAIPNYTLCR